MHCHFTTTAFSGTVPTSSPVRAHYVVSAIALLMSAAAYASPFPPQQLTVAFTNAFPNGSVDTLTMPNPNSAAIVAANPLYTGGTPQNLYTAVTWVTNPVTSTLDLIYADAEQHKIWRLAGPSYAAPSVIFSWSGRGSGPPYPVGLAADSAGNVYVISPSCAWDRPGVWVLPFVPAGANAGTYAAPVLIDNTFNDPVTGRPVTTLALAEVLVASTTATPMGSAAPAWNPLDLLVLVGDTFSTRVIRYSQAQIQNVIASQSSLRGPASTLVTQAQFLTQSVLKIPPVVIGMDIARDPNTQDVTLLFSTAGGRILDFDSAKNAFITPYAINLGLGLTRLKVGTFQGSQYVFVGQLPGQILEFAAPRAGSSDSRPFASVSKGVSNPTALAVTNSGSASAGSCINNAAGCAILPQLSLDISGPGTANIPKNATIVADSCTIAADPRVTISDGAWSCQTEPLPLADYCGNLPQVVLSGNMCGKSGPTGAGLSIAKLIPSPAIEQNVNNTLTTFIVSPSITLPAGSNPNPNCGDASGPIVAWGPLPGVESNIPEGNTLIDVTVACVPDPPPAGKGSHPSVVVQGLALVSLNAAYVAGEFANLQTAFSQLTSAGQIVDNTNVGVVSTIQFYITQSQAYFAAGSYSCAVNSLWNGVQYVNGLVNAPATAGDFVAGTPPGADQNPSGTLVMRFDHLYYDVNVIAGNPPITSDALSLPAGSVPACAGAASVTIPPFSPGQAVPMLVGQRALFTGRITPSQTCSTPTWTVAGSSITLAAGPSYGLVDASAASVSTLTLTDAIMSGSPLSTSLQIAVNGDLWFWSSSSAEINTLIANTNGAYAIDGPTYDIATTNIDPSTNAVNPNLIPLYRYLNNSTQTHFWTAYPSGELLTGWTLEGQTGWVFSIATGGAQPVYRFYNPTTNVHFWTFDSNGEGQLSNGFQLEGIVFYAQPGGSATNMTPMIRARCTLCVTPPETQFPIANLPPNPTPCPPPP